MSLGSASAARWWFTLIFTLFQKLRLTNEGGATEAQRRRDRKVAIALVGRESISEVHRLMNITPPPQRL